MDEYSSGTYYSITLILSIGRECSSFLIPAGPGYYRNVSCIWHNSVRDPAMIRLYLLFDALAKLAVVHEQAPAGSSRAEMPERPEHLQRPTLHLNVPEQYRTYRKQITAYCTRYARRGTGCPKVTGRGVSVTVPILLS